MPILVPLVALDVLVLVLWTIAAALAIALIMREIGNILAVIPVVGGYLARAAGAIGNAVSTAVGFIERGIDHLIGAAWHLLARYMDELWHQIETQSGLMAQFGQIIGNELYKVTGLRSLVHRLEQAWHGIEHGVKTLTREFNGIEHRVKTLERQLVKGIGHDLRIQVAGLENEVTHLERRVIPDVRRGIRTAEGEVTQLEQFIKALPGVRYGEWAAGIVAAGLGAELLNLFKCPTFLNKTLGRGCGLWNALEDILGLFGGLFLFTAFCDFLPTLEQAAGVVLAPVISLVSTFADGACSHPPSSFAWFNVTVPPTPPTGQSLGTTPS